MGIKSFQDLRTWQEARQLIREVYLITEKFPKDEKYSLVAQMRSAAISVAANIAEGMGRQTTNDLCHFLIMARGSTHEMISHLLISHDLGYISSEEKDAIVFRYSGLGAGINGHIKSLKNAS